MRYILIIIDFFFSLIFIAISSITIFLLIGVRRKKKQQAEYKLLVIETNYSYNGIKQYGKEQYILKMDLKGFFSKVYFCYPILGIHPQDKDVIIIGCRRIIKLSKKHIIIEMKALSDSILKLLPKFNFLITQFTHLLWLRKMIFRHHISVIRASEPFFTGTIAYLLSRMTNRPFALRIGCNYDLLNEKNGTMILPHLFRSYTIQKAIGKFILPHANMINAANKSYYDYCLANGAKKESLEIIRFGSIIAPIHFTSPNLRVANKSRYPFIGNPFGIYVGRLTKVKLPESLLLVTKKIQQKYPDIRVVLIGDGDMRPNLEKQAKELGISDNLIFLGNLKQAEIASILPFASAYLAPHSGLSLVEAALAKIPLIAYDYEWHPELVIPEKTGLLAPHQNWEVMADCFIKILSNIEYAHSLGENARILALDMMDQDKIQMLEISCYNKILVKCE